MIKLAMISIFGIFGVLARYLIGLYSEKIFALSVTFPYGTFFINIIGSFLIGIVFVLGVERSQINNVLKTSLLVGFLGGFTTFSSYSLDSFQFIEKAEYLKAGLYMFGSPALGVFATFLGVLLARNLLVF